MGKGKILGKWCDRGLGGRHCFGGRDTRFRQADCQSAAGCQPVGMALRATKDDENLARAHFPRQYIDAAPRRQVAGGWCDRFSTVPHNRIVAAREEADG